MSTIKLCSVKFHGTVNTFLKQGRCKLLLILCLKFDFMSFKIKFTLNSHHYNNGSLNGLNNFEGVPSWPSEGFRDLSLIFYYYCGIITAAGWRWTSTFFIDCAESTMSRRVFSISVLFDGSLLSFNCYMYLYYVGLIGLTFQYSLTQLSDLKEVKLKKE